MKIFRILVLTVLIFVVVSVAGAYFFLKAFDEEKYKPLIEKKASEAIGREVAIGKIKPGFLFPSELTLELDAISASSQGSQQVDAGQVILKADLLSALVKRQLDFSTAEINNIRVLITEPKKISITGLNVKLNQLRLGLSKSAGEDFSLSAKLVIEKGKISSDYLVKDVSKINASADITEKNINITQAVGYIGDGSVSLTGKVEDYRKTASSSFNLQSKDLKVQDLVPQFDSGASLEGDLSFSGNASFVGFGPDMIKKSLSGSFDAQILNGKIRDLNVLKLALSKISMIPNLVERILVNLPQKYQEALSSNDTKINRMSSSLNIQDQEVKITDALLDAEGFKVEATGSVNFQQYLNLDAWISIPQDLSQSMIKGASELELLADKSGEISIPVNISGTIPEVSVMPDLTYIAKKLARSEAEKYIDKALEGTFKKEGDAEEGEEPKPSEVIGGVLDTIFGGKEKKGD